MLSVQGLWPKACSADWPTCQLVTAHWQAPCLCAHHLCPSTSVPVTESALGNFHSCGDGPLGVCACRCHCCQGQVHHEACGFRPEPEGPGQAAGHCTAQDGIRHACAGVTACTCQVPDDPQCLPAAPSEVSQLADEVTRHLPDVEGSTHLAFPGCPVLRSTRTHTFTTSGSPTWQEASGCLRGAYFLTIA